MTSAEAQKWVAELFEESPDRITPASTRADIAAWDSLGVLTLMAGLNQQFEIVLSNDEIAAIDSVNDILTLLKNSGKLTD